MIDIISQINLGFILNIIIGSSFVGIVIYFLHLYSDIKFLKSQVSNHIPTQIKEVKENIKEVKENIKEIKENIKEVKEDVRDTNHKIDNMNKRFDDIYKVLIDIKNK